MQALAGREINEVLVESGQELNGALLQAGLIDEFIFYYAPLLLGSDARGMFALPAMTAMSQRIDLQLISVDRIGADLRVRAKAGT